MESVRSVKAEYTVAIEPWAKFIADAEPILYEHWDELAIHKDIDLDPDYYLYAEMERLGWLVIYTVRHPLDGLVGYALYVVRPHLHYRKHLWASNDIILIRSSHRNAGCGNTLMEFVERDLKERGVAVISTGTKVAHPELARLLEARGHAKGEIGFTLRL